MNAGDHVRERGTLTLWWGEFSFHDYENEYEVYTCTHYTHHNEQSTVKMPQSYSLFRMLTLKIELMKLKLN